MGAKWGIMEVHNNIAAAAGGAVNVHGQTALQSRRHCPGYEGGLWHEHCGESAIWGKLYSMLSCMTIAGVLKACDSVAHAASMSISVAVYKACSVAHAAFMQAVEWGRNNSR